MARVRSSKVFGSITSVSSRKRSNSVLSGYCDSIDEINCARKDGAVVVPELGPHAGCTWCHTDPLLDEAICQVVDGTRPVHVCWPRLRHVGPILTLPRAMRS